MEPTAPQQPQFSPSEQPAKPKWPRKNIIMAAAITVVVLLGISFVVGRMGGNDSPGGSDSSIYYDRSGYSRDELGDSVGDPAAFKFTGGSKAVSYRGQTVIQACNLLKPDELQKQDLRLQAKALPTAVTRAYNDGAGKAAYAKTSASSLDSFGLGLDLNNCTYTLQNNQLATVSLSVFQPFTLSPKVITEEISENYKPASTVGGMKAYKPVRADSSSAPDGPAAANFIVVKPDKSGFFVSMKLPQGKEGKQQALLQTIAANFAREYKRPSAAPVTAYDSPVFGKSFARACDLVTNGDIRALTGRDAGPLALEGIASAVGVVDYAAGQQASKKYDYISNECTRTTVGGGLSILGGGAARLKVQTTSYLEDTPAKGQIAENRQTNPNNKANMPVDGVGDEAVAYENVVGDTHLLVRSGRFVADLSLDQVTRRTLNVHGLSDGAAKLKPIAQAIAKRFGS